MKRKIAFCLMVIMTLMSINVYDVKAASVEAIFMMRICAAMMWMNSVCCLGEAIAIPLIKRHIPEVTEAPLRLI